MSELRPSEPLQSVSVLPWESDPGTTAVRGAIRALGFREIGHFRCSVNCPEGLIAAFFPPAHIYAMVFAPSEGRYPTELWCRLDEVTGISVSNHPEIQPPLHAPPHGMLVHLPAAQVGTLFRSMLDKAAGLDRDPASSEAFVAAYGAARHPPDPLRGG